MRPQCGGTEVVAGHTLRLLCSVGKALCRMRCKVSAWGRGIPHGCTMQPALCSPLAHSRRGQKSTAGDKSQQHSEHVVVIRSSFDSPLRGARMDMECRKERTSSISTAACRGAEVSSRQLVRADTRKERTAAIPTAACKAHGRTAWGAETSVLLVASDNLGVPSNVPRTTSCHAPQYPDD